MGGEGAAGPVLCFAGHTDVVPTGPLEEWHSDPFQPEIRDGLLYGRGAADMKSGLAAMVTATEAFVAERPGHQGSIAFLITSDEEGPSVDGTKRVVETLIARGQRIDWCIVGEPSSEKADRRHDQDRPARLAVGPADRARHPGPHRLSAAAPRTRCTRFAPALAELTRHVWDQGNEHFQPTSFQISNLNAGTGAPNVIPGELKARFNLRYSPVQTLDGLKRTVEDILQRHKVRYTLDWYLSGEPFYTQPGRCRPPSARRSGRDRPLSRQLSTSGGTSDGRFIAPMGARSSSWACRTRPSTRSMSACGSRTSTRCTRSTCRCCAACWAEGRLTRRQRRALKLA